MAATTVATGRNPLHAWIGAGDLAVEKVKELPSEVVKLQTRIVGLPTQARTQATEQVKVLKGLPKEVRAKADELTTKANSLYAELTKRGEQVLARRNSKATTEELQEAATA